jgi:NTP pyrophosphatase (non-canonical NTP hydrolase)
MTTAIDMHRAINGPAGPTVAELVERCGRWSVATFGLTPEGSAAQELRLLSEVVELCLAAGASPHAIESEVTRAAVRAGALPSTMFASDRSQPRPEKIPEEMADTLIVLAQLAYRRGIDLGGETLKKQDRNETKRTWKSNGDGTGRHIEPPDKSDPAPASHDQETSDA